MALDFGALNDDDITIGSHFNSNVSGWIFMAWFLPTTLTAGRTYWGASSLISVKVDATTSELVVAVDRTTTDSVWKTSGAGIVTTEAVFVALVKSSNSGAANWRCWIGHGTAQPQEVTITETTVGSGTEVAGSNMVVGNVSSAGTIAFQGGIGQFLDARFSLSALAMFANETVGTITQAEADYFLQTVIIPYWQGRPQCAFVRGTTTAVYLADCEGVGTQLFVDQRGATQRLGPIALTVSGATPGETRQPMKLLSGYPQRINQTVRRR